MDTYTIRKTSVSARKNHKSKRLKKRTLHLVDAPPSAGKTFCTAQYIQANVKRCNHLIVQPTDVVINETTSTLKQLGLKAVVIDSYVLHDLAKATALANILITIGLDKAEAKELIKRKKPTVIIDAFLKHAGKSGHILLITHAAYLLLPYFHSRENWKIYFDECVQIDRYHEFDISQNVDVVKSRVAVDSIDERSGLAVLKPLNSSLLKREIATPDDVLKGVDGLLDFLRDVNDGNQETFIDPEHWEGMGTDFKFLNAVAMMKPDKFKGVTLLSANIEHSMMHRWFTARHGLETDVHPITDNLRYTDLTHLKDRVRIHYLTNGWHTGYGTKNLCKQYQHTIDKKAKEFIGSRSFIYAANKFYQGKLTKDNKIPVVSHGLNQYDNETIYFHNVTQNRNDQHFKLLAKLGLDEQFVTIATVVEGAYQSAMRTNLRKKDSDKKVDILVLGDALARQIAGRFGLGVDEPNYIGGAELDFTNSIPIKTKCTAPRKQFVRGISSQCKWL